MEGDNWAFIWGKNKLDLFEICLFGIIEAEKIWKNKIENNVLDLK